MDESTHDARAWFFLARTYHVFNLEQCSELDALRDEGRAAFEPLETAQRILDASGVRIRHGGGAAYYDPKSDEITLPHPADFLRRDGYYAVAFHELSHASGAPHRLNRLRHSRFGDRDYAFDELVAELGASFLSARSGIEHVSEAAAYLGAWLRLLHEDHWGLFAAARLAQQAADFFAPCEEVAAGALDAVALASSETTGAVAGAT